MTRGPSARLGVDVGGSGVKAAIVDLETGEATGRIRVETPQPATPDAIAKSVGELIAEFEARQVASDDY